MISRRRALTIMAGCLPAPAFAGDVQQWQGTAMGTEARIILSGHAGSHYRVFRKIEQIIAGVETAFSLHADSELAHLNASGVLRHPTQDMVTLLDLCDRLNMATARVFDPTVQPLWLALARGEDAVRARGLIGWHRVTRSADGIVLPRDFQLTLNGIAQGFCADKVASFLRDQGFEHVMVDTGELHAIGPQSGGAAWPVTISDEAGETLQHLPLANRALATSSPRGTRLARGEPHILGPQGQAPQWNTVSISAKSAAVADALSTAACLMDKAAIDRALVHFPDARIECLT